MNPVVGGYELVAPLASGGMGAVWRAIGPDGRPAAVKTLISVDPSTLAALRREVWALQRVRHPNVVRLLDHGVADGRPWIAMELVEGEALRARVNTSTTDRSSGALTFGVTSYEEVTSGGSPVGPTSGLPWPEAAALAADLASAVGALHERGLVHRDLKPENVLVRPDGSLVLVDLGLAALATDAAGRDLGDLPFAGGTVAYMAPEQIRREAVDGRADLYALGCVIYELLTGRPPFLGTVDEVVAQHQHGHPVPPRDRVPDLPSAIDELVMAMLAKPVDARPAHADDVVRALEAVGVAGGPRPATRPALYRAPLVGREAALAAAAPAIAALLEGRGGSVIVAGDQGSGRTRLATELAASVPRSKARVFAASPARGEGPLAALSGPLAAVVDACEARPEAAAAWLGPEGPVLARFAPSLARLVTPAVTDDIPDLALRRRLWQALTHAFAAVAAPRRAVVVVEGLEAAGPLVTGFVSHVARQDEPAPLLVVATCRGAVPEEAAQAVVVRAEPLSVGAVDRMVTGLLGRSDHGLGAAAHAIGGGAPLLAVELVQVAIDRGALRHGAACWERAEVALPATVDELLRARLDGLVAEEARAVDVVALLGPWATVDRVADVLGCSRADAVACLDRLAERRLLLVDADLVAPAHDRLRVALVARAHRDVRERVTAALAAVEGAEALQFELLVGLGRIDEGLQVVRRGGRRAVERSDWPEAERLFRRAIALSSGSRRVHLTLEFASEVLEVRSRLDEASEVVAELRVLPDLEPSLRAMIERQVGRILYRLGRHAEAVPVLEGALALARAVGEPSQILRCLNNLGITLRELGRLDEAEAVFQEQVAMFGDGTPALDLIHAVGNLGLIAVDRGELELAAERYLRVLGMQRELGAPLLDQSITLGNLAATHMRAWRLEESRALFLDGLSAARQIGDVLGVIQCLSCLAMVAYRQGDPARCAALGDEGLALDATRAYPRDRTSLLAVSALGHHALGELSDDALADALAACRHHELRYEVSNLGLALGASRLRAGDRDGASAALELVFEASSPRETEQARAHALAGSLALAGGDRAEAERRLVLAGSVRPELALPERVALAAALDRV